MSFEIIESYSNIKEMDLNPVILHQEGLDIVDASIILKPQQTEQSMAYDHNELS